MYLAVCCRDWSVSQTKAPLHTVEVALSNSDDPSLPPGAEPADRVTLHRARNLETDMGGKTFVSLQSGWIVGIGGNPGSTIIFDTKSGRMIRGPNLVARKWSPVVAVVGDRIYALTSTPDYIQEPNFVPWFEVLDISKPDVTETAEGVLSLVDTCTWTPLPYPLCFPRRLTPTDFRMPPRITVTSSVVVEPYILISVSRPYNSTYAFDTSSGEWHEVEGEQLPFVGAAAPHGGGIFLAPSHKYGPIKAYRIRVSTSGKGGAIELSTTVIPVRNEEHEEIDAGGARYVYLDREHFALLSWHKDSGRYMAYDTKTDETYPRKLYLKLVTYRTRRCVLEGKTPDIVVSCQPEQAFRICSSPGFSDAPIAFALSI